MTSPTQQRAIVVFSGQADIWWVRILKPGYRHCFVMLKCGEHWLLYNPLSNCTQIDLMRCPTEEALIDWIRTSEYTSIETVVRLATDKPLPWRPFTCVEAVLRAVGLRKRWCFTPWQLFKALEGEAS